MRLPAAMQRPGAREGLRGPARGARRTAALLVLEAAPQATVDRGCHSERSLRSEESTRSDLPAASAQAGQRERNATAKAVSVTAAMRGDAGGPWVSARKVLWADDEALTTIVQRLLGALDLPGSKFGMLWTRLDRVRKEGEIDIPIVSVTLDIEEVTEIFGRLNSAGTKVTEADIALALVASRNPGWVRDEFLPFVQKLEEAGFEIGPNVVFRSLVAIGQGRARLKEVPHKYWVSADLKGAWDKTHRAWRKTIQYIEQRGVLSAGILRTLLAEQLIADRDLLVVERYREFLQERSIVLAEAANQYYSRLEKDTARLTNPRICRWRHAGDASSAAGRSCLAPAGGGRATATAAASFPRTRCGRSRPAQSAR